MDVPKWLSHLPRDRRGIPVPWINAWGAESPDLWSIRHDPLVGGPALFVADDPDQPPDFTRQNIQRQRQAVLQGCCQVCARYVAWERRMLVVADLSVTTIDLAGRRVPVLTEPWLCERCAHFATVHCPALIRRTRSERLRVVRVESRGNVQIVISNGWVEGPLEEESKRLAPAMWAKIILAGVEVHAVPE